MKQQILLYCATILVFIVRCTSAAIFLCSCQCPYGSKQTFALTTTNSPTACVTACIQSRYTPCSLYDTYACLGTNCAYSALYFYPKITTSPAPLVRCSCECRYGSTRSFVYTRENFTEGCVRACTTIPVDTCDSSNTYACLGTECAFSSLTYNSSKELTTSYNQCSCQCPYGSSRNFVYTIESSPEGCVRACVGVPSNPCVGWNTYACLGTNCVYSNSYIYLRTISASSCPITLEDNINATIDSIIDDFDTNGTTFSVTEQNMTNLVDPRDIKVLAFYRRVIAQYMYTDEACFEQIQVRIREHLLDTLGCKIADIEKLLQWNWIPRTEHGFRLFGQPLKVPLPQNGKIYSAVRGISFYDNGSFILNLIEAEDNNALFNSDDVELVMKHGITGASFSLDSPLVSSLHPFTKGTWVPYNALNDTDFLATMLHVDLWLKTMSYFTEASVNSPFRIRSIRDGIYSVLPEDLYQRLFKENYVEQNKLPLNTRTWIESGPIKYNIIEENGNLMYTFGSSNMQIKYENFLRHVQNESTAFVDITVESNSSWYDHFTTTATQYYNELGHLFPELLRLAELSKLSAIALLFQHRYRELRRVTQPPSIEVKLAQLFNLFLLILIS